MKLNVGCGANVRDGWWNVDMESDDPAVTLFDVRKHMQYVADESIKMIYSEHFVEHLTLAEGERFFAECLRVLVPGGVMRISTPDLLSLAVNYIAKRIDAYSAVGFVPPTLCDMVNQSMTDWGHKYLYDWEKLENVLRDTGFRTVLRYAPGVTEVEGMLTETRPPFGDLVVECMK